MYDEPRRAAVEQAKKKIEKTILPAPKKERKPKADKPPPRKRVKKQAPPKIIEESSESETESSSSETELSETEREDEQTPMEVEEEKRVNDRVTEIEKLEEKREIEDTKTSEEELINNLIMLEHNYFGAPPPTISVVNKTNDTGKTKLDRTNNEIPNERKAIKRRLESPEKAELKYKFQMRTKEEEEKIIWNIYDESLDDEDLGYMKGAFESLQQVASKEVESYSWSDLPCILFKIMSFSFLHTSLRIPWF